MRPDGRRQEGLKLMPKSDSTQQKHEANCSAILDRLQSMPKNIYIHIAARRGRPQLRESAWYESPGALLLAPIACRQKYTPWIPATEGLDSTCSLETEPSTDAAASSTHRLDPALELGDARAKPHHVNSAMRSESTTMSVLAWRNNPCFWPSSTLPPRKPAGRGECMPPEWLPVPSRCSHYFSCARNTCKAPGRFLARRRNLGACGHR